MQDFVALTSIPKNRTAEQVAVCFTNNVVPLLSITKMQLQKCNGISISDVAWIFRAERKESLWCDRMYPSTNSVFWDSALITLAARVGWCLRSLSVQRRLEVCSLQLSKCPILSGEWICICNQWMLDSVSSLFSVTAHMLPLHIHCQHVYIFAVCVLNYDTLHVNRVINF